MPPAEVIDTLRRIGRPALAELLVRRGDLPLGEYSAGLHRHRPARPLEPALCRAFRAELGRLTLPAPEIEAVMERLEQSRVLQTATHVTASEGPIFFAMHALGTLALAPEEPYVVGACSGIPFSNIARPGSLNFSRRHPLSAFLDGRSPAYRARMTAFAESSSAERRLSLIPWSSRDAPVWRAPIPPELCQLLTSLKRPIRELLPPASPGESFSRWALSACSGLESKLLDRRLVFLDLNEVVASYLTEVLAEREHPIDRLLFAPSSRDRILGELPSMALFTTAHGPPNRPIFEPLRLIAGALRGSHTELPLHPESVLEGLRSGRLCPGVFLTFSVLTFVADFKCLGGVDQIEYLPLFRGAWAKGDLLSPEDLASRVLDGLTTGRCVDEAGEAVYPLDIALGTPWSLPRSSTLLGFMGPQLPRLLKRPFRWAAP